MTVWVLSTGRTGTNYLAKALETFTCIHTRHQTSGSRLLNIWGNISLLSSGRSAPVNRLLTKRILGKKEKQVIVDPLLSMVLVDSYSAIEGHPVRVVHLIRDPRDFVSSFMSWKAGSVKKTILHHMVPFWQPSPLIAGDVTLRERVGMSKFEQFCWNWNFKNRLFYDRVSGADTSMLIKFEEMVNRESGEQVIKSLLEFMGISNTQIDLRSLETDKINESPDGGFPNWRDWSSEQVQIMDRWCGVLMREYGYGLEPDWQNKLADTHRSNLFE